MPGRIRTPDLLGRNQLLYPAELRAHKYIYYYKVDFYLLAMLILTAHALYSGVSVIKSTASEVKSLVLVLSGKAKLIKIAPSGDLSVILALAVTDPLLDSTFIISFSLMDRFLASKGFISTNSSEIISSNPFALPV